MLRIIDNHDKCTVSVYFNDVLDVEFDVIDFILLTALHISEQVSMMELVKCWQEQTP